ncbi:hypothetical protein TWF696_007200 [Orbilia brochopaga]|uniref:Uncharacterized protein n=1 Tax=Orbilia brochopaga TaxID=3140254 RepID=A0AAV9UXX0_9PEZI
MGLESYSNQIPIGESGILSTLKQGIDKALQSFIPASEQTDENWARLKEICDTIYTFCREHPDLCKFILFTVGGIITIPLLLEVAGFSLLGPVAGSFAAFWQSRIGNVAAGSFFAWLQRVGMSPATRVGTGALVGFAGFLWVEIKKVISLDPGGGRQNSTGQAMRQLNPVYRGFAALRQVLQ